MAVWHWIITSLRLLLFVHGSLTLDHNLTEVIVVCMCCSLTLDHNLSEGFVVCTYSSLTLDHNLIEVIVVCTSCTLTLDHNLAEVTIVCACCSLTLDHNLIELLFWVHIKVWHWIITSLNWLLSLHVAVLTADHNFTELNVASACCSVTLKSPLFVHVAVWHWIRKRCVEPDWSCCSTWTDWRHMRSAAYLSECVWV